MPASSVQVLGTLNETRSITGARVMPVVVSSSVLCGVLMLCMCVHKGTEELGKEGRGKEGGGREDLR